MHNKHLALMIKNQKYRGMKIPRYDNSGNGIVWDTIKSVAGKVLPIIAQKVLPKIIEKGKEFIINKIKKKPNLSPRAREILNLIEGVA